MNDFTSTTEKERFAELGPLPNNMDFNTLDYLFWAGFLRRLNITHSSKIKCLRRINKTFGGDNNE